MRLVKPSLLLAATAALTVGIAVPAAATASDDPGERPAGCSSHFGDPNVRERTINSSGADLHNMSNPPTCSPHGPYMGHLSPGSHFNVYYADPAEPNWCYGYSIQLARKGYILCSDYS